VGFYLFKMGVLGGCADVRICRCAKMKVLLK
jgi:hypothetical protein